MQDRKTAEAGKNALGPIEGEKKEKSSSFGKKKVFCRLEKKMLVGKQNVGWRISPAKFPVMQDRKTAEAGKNPLGPRGRKRKFDIFFLSVGEKKCRLEKKCQRSRMTGFNLRPRTVIRNGNIHCCHAEGAPGSIPEGPRIRGSKGPAGTSIKHKFATSDR